MGTGLIAMPGEIMSCVFGVIHICVMSTTVKRRRVVCARIDSGHGDCVTTADRRV